MRSLSHAKLENVDEKSLRERSDELQDILRSSMQDSFGEPDYLAELLKIERELIVKASKIPSEGIGNVELKNDLVAAWNEISEVVTDYEQLANDELMKCKKCIKQRLDDALHWLGKYVSEKDVLKTIDGGEN